MTDIVIASVVLAFSLQGFLVGLYAGYTGLQAGPVDRRSSTVGYGLRRAVLPAVLLLVPLALLAVVIALNLGRVGGLTLSALVVEIAAAVSALIAAVGGSTATGSVLAVHAYS
jgi:hypothetical protein